MKYTPIIATVTALASPANAELILTGIIDGPLGTTAPRAVEIYVSANIADASIYGVAKASNGSATVPTTPEFRFPAVPLTAGTFIYLATESANFNNYFGFTPTYTNSNATLFNGDDVVVILKSNGTTYDITDAFGIIGTRPALDTAWNYLDSFAYRKSNTGPTATFNLADWTFPPDQSDALDGRLTNPAAGDPEHFPVGSYVSSGADDDFASWIGGFDVEDLDGPNDDPDGDFIPNLLENLLGLAPDMADQGSLVEVTGASPGAVTFVHSLSKDIASDVEAAYEWSTGLDTWTAAGETSGGVTVQFSAPSVLDGTDPDYDVVQVIANVTAGTAGKLFVRLVAKKTP